MSKRLENTSRGRPKKGDYQMSKQIKNYFVVANLLKEKPHRVNEIQETTKIPRSTIYKIIEGLIGEKMIKSLGDGRYVEVNYYLLEEKIEKWFDTQYKKELPKMYPRSKINISAIILKEENNEDFADAFKNVCKRKKIYLIDG